MLSTVWSLLRNGRALRHLPVVAPPGRDVRIVLRGVGPAALDVSNDHVPVSLRPLVLGVRLDVAPDATSTLSLCFEHAADGYEFGRLDAEVTAALPMARGALWLISPKRCRNRCAGTLARWARYALAWRNARRSAARGDRLRMSAGDLRCLNLYYAWARPVYLVGVRDGDRTNLFPMDLVGRLSTGEFLLALRATSPSVEIMEQTRRIALSAAPADRLHAVYALGDHHRAASVDLSRLPFETRPSPGFGLPSLAGRLSLELTVREVHRIGSHVLFVTRVDADGGRHDRQLAHVSAMYAEWVERRHGTRFTPAS